MATHTTWIAHALTAAMSEARFAGPEEPLHPVGLRHAHPLAFPCPDRTWCSPAACARETAAALNLDAVPEPALRDADAGADEED